MSRVKNIQCRCGKVIRINTQNITSPRFNCPQCGKKFRLQVNQKSQANQKSSNSISPQTSNFTGYSQRAADRSTFSTNRPKKKPANQPKTVFEIFGWIFAVLVIIAMGIGGSQAIGPALKHLTPPSVAELTLHEGVPISIDDKTDTGRKYGRYLVFQIGDQKFKSDQRIVSDEAHYAIQDACRSHEPIQIWTDGTTSWEYSGGRPCIWRIGKNGQILMEVSDFSGSYRMSALHALIIGVLYLICAVVVLPISFFVFIRQKFWKK